MLNFNPYIHVRGVPYGKKNNQDLLRVDYKPKGHGDITYFIYVCRNSLQNRSSFSANIQATISLRHHVDHEAFNFLDCEIIKGRLTTEQKDAFDTFKESPFTNDLVLSAPDFAIFEEPRYIDLDQAADLSETAHENMGIRDPYHGYDCSNSVGFSMALNERFGIYRPRDIAAHF